MPLVRIDLRTGRSPDLRRALGNAVYRAMTDVANVPDGDRFVVITEHDASGLLYDPSYLGVEFFFCGRHKSPRELQATG